MSGPSPQAMVDVSHPGRSPSATCCCILVAVFTTSVLFLGYQDTWIIVLAIIFWVLTGVVAVVEVREYLRNAVEERQAKEERERRRIARRQNSRYSPSIFMDSEGFEEGMTKVLINDILRAVSKLRNQDREEFTPKELRDLIDGMATNPNTPLITDARWGDYMIVLRGMRVDPPDDPLPTEAKFLGVFHRIGLDTYALTDHGEELLQERNREDEKYK